MHQNNIQYNNSNCVSFQPMHGIPSEITDGFFRLRSTTLKEEISAERNFDGKKFGGRQIKFPPNLIHFTKYPNLCFFRPLNRFSCFFNNNFGQKFFLY